MPFLFTSCVVPGFMKESHTDAKSPIYLSHRYPLAFLASAEVNAALNDAAPVNVPTVAVTNSGNTPDPVTLAGAVDHDFRIAQFDITIGQYTDFLNAVAQADPNGLYNPKMATDLQVAGIARTGSPGMFKYTVIPPSGPIQISAATPDQRPITYVSWFDAARFCQLDDKRSALRNADKKNDGKRGLQPSEYQGKAWARGSQKYGQSQYGFTTDLFSSYGNRVVQGRLLYQWNDLDGTAGPSRGLRGGFYFAGLSG
jgi:hypothetical protein